MGPEQLPRADAELAAIAITQRDGLPSRTLVAMAASAAIGAGVLTAAYAVAATGGGATRFVLFWLGLGLGVLPLLAGLLSNRSNPLQRVMLLVTLGAYTTLPKLLRGPVAPVYSDELQHWRQVNDIVESGVLGRMHSLLRMLGAFPGLHGVTAALTELTGLQSWTVARALTVVCHVLVLVALMLLVREATGSLRLAALTAGIYTINPSWLFFDVQFAYETFALPLAFACLALTARAATSSGRQRRTAMFGAFTLVAAVTVVHHLSAIILTFILTLVFVFAVARRRRGETGPEESRAIGAVLGAAAGIGLLWTSRHLGLLLDYLSPSITRSSRQLSELGARLLGTAAPAADAAGKSHRLFSGTTLPAYEVAAGFMVPLLLLLAAVLAWRWREEMNHRSAFARGLMALSVLYFGSLPFILTPGGSEGARRSWAWSFIGLALVASLLSIGVAGRWGQWRPLHRRLVQAAMAALFIVAAMGSVASGQNEAYRFPGAFELGRDARSLDLEARDAAEWLRANVGPGQHVIADRYTGLALNAFGRQDMAAPSAGFPAWDLVFSDEPPSDELLYQLRIPFPYTYLVVDRRLARERPQSGLWFTVDEPGRGEGLLAPAGALARYDCLPWTTPVYASTHLTIYRIDLDAFDRAATAAAAGRCAQ